MSADNKHYRDRSILIAAQSKGRWSTGWAYLRLSGPGWLQSAITLGGGSLGSALYLGVICGTAMLWLNLLAIAVGVIMLAAISHVVLATGKRPFQAINEHVNPVLGVGWLAGTMVANLIWCLPQFSLCFDSLQGNLFPDNIPDTPSWKYGISIGIMMAAYGMVHLSWRGEWAGKVFGLLLKMLVGLIVCCFVAVVAFLLRTGQIEWNQILDGLLPQPWQWFHPSDTIHVLLSALPDSSQTYWNTQIVGRQREVMISTAATAVGINMTFLLPYSMLHRGWDRPFRGLAIFDLVTAMAIPFVLVVSCIVIAAAFSFHGKVDPSVLSNRADQIQTSGMFDELAVIVGQRILAENPQAFDDLAETSDPLLRKERIDERIAQYLATMPESERKVAAVLVKPSARHLAHTLTPILGIERGNFVFGLGALAMGFSTIVILMLINGFACAELAHCPGNVSVKMLGGLIVGIVGASWPLVWQGESKTWLIILASTFGAILLPVAYITFFALMNSSTLLQADRPRGWRRWVWNGLMSIAVVVASAQAASSVYTKLHDPSSHRLVTLHAGSLILGGVATFIILALLGFSAASRRAVLPNRSHGDNV